MACHAVRVSMLPFWGNGAGKRGYIEDHFRCRGRPSIIPVFKAADEAVDPLSAAEIQVLKRCAKTSASGIRRDFGIKQLRSRPCKPGAAEAMRETPQRSTARQKSCS
jgi:hypothetical protein